jgi:RNA 2',3'-cyclic 3'-phosphodiesterase
VTDRDAAADERVRLFVALELPDQIRDTLVRWRARLPGVAQATRPIEPRDLHATLCFLGWRGTDEISSIADALGVLVPAPAPQLALADAIWLPRRRPRVLAVSLRDERGTLAAAQSALSQTLAAGGWYEPEARAYLGHVTVARAGHGTTVPRKALPDPPEVEFLARRVTLYRSRLHRSGATYEALASVELAG